MPAVLPFLPLISAGIGGVTSLISGNRADQQNQQQIGLAQQSQQRQQALIQQMMAGINPAAYQEQARQASGQAFGQLSSDFASRGLLSSGALYTAGANASNKAYADAGAAYQRDRLQAYGIANGAQQNVTQNYGQFVNPNPYAGLGSSLGALGTAGAAYLSGQQPQQPVSSGVSMPGFGVRYPAPTTPGWGR